MKKNKRTILMVLAGLAMLLIISALVIVAINFSRSWYLSRRPLIQIYSPANHQPLSTGRPVQFRASARSKDGIARLELWVDGAMIKAEDYGSKGRISPSVTLSSGWVPSSIGQHTLIAVAYTAAGIKGQGTVFAQALTGEEIGNHPRVEFTKEGDTLASIAAANGTTTESLQELNPNVGNNPLPAGSALFVPGGSGGDMGGEDEPIPPSDDPPADAPPEPGMFDGLLFLFAMPLEAPASNEPISLRVDAQTLRTGSAYEALHCYMSLAGTSPRWYPDADGDQSSDESFSLLEGTQWDIASHLGGDDGVIVTWQQNQAIPLQASCVGIAGGGTDAVNLGAINLSIDPDAWDGSVREVTSGGGEDIFVLGYRIVHIGIENVPKGIDETMSTPYDLGYSGTTLSWRYHPAPTEAPIDGFRIYLNGTLLWITPAEPMQTEIAREWMEPPCRSTNSFTVSAFRYGPDDPESNPSEALSFSNSLECTREIFVRWLEMRTHDLGGLIEEHHVVGPANGDFTAEGSSIADLNEKHIEGACLGSGICGEFGMQSDNTYDLGELFDYFGNTTATSSVIVDTFSDLTLTYDWWDLDGTLYANHICEGSVTIPYDSLDSTHDITIGDSVGGHCTITATLDQIEGPVGEGGSAIVLPDLMVTDMKINDDGLLNVSILNNGLAALPARDLTILVQSRQTEESVRYVIPNAAIEAGETIEVSSPEITAPERPLDVCVTIDPDNEFLDAMDALGGRDPFCGKLPDLYIFDTQYQYEGDRLHIILYNGGDANLLGETIEFALTASDGSSFRPPEVFQNISIPMTRMRDISFPLGGIRDQLSGGYSVIVDPQNEIDEKREDNNTREIDAPIRLQISWTDLFYPYYEGVDLTTQVQEYNMQIMAISQDERSLEDWPLGPYEVEVPSTSHIEPGQSVEVQLASDEDLEIEVAGQIRDGDNRIDLGRVNDVFDITEGFGAANGIHPDGDCVYGDAGEHGWQIYPPGDIGEINAPWVVQFTICRLE